MKSREGNKVDSKLSKVRVELTRESKAASNSRHGSRNEMVEVSISGGGQLEGSETDIVEGFVVNDHAFVSVFYQLMN